MPLPMRAAAGPVRFHIGCNMHNQGGGGYRTAPVRLVPLFLFVYGVGTLLLLPPRTARAQCPPPVAPQAELEQLLDTCGEWVCAVRYDPSTNGGLLPEEDPNPWVAYYAEGTQVEVVDGKLVITSPELGPWEFFSAAYIRWEDVLLDHDTWLYLIQVRYKVHDLDPKPWLDRVVAAIGVADDEAVSSCGVGWYDGQKMVGIGDWYTGMPEQYLFPWDWEQDETTYTVVVNRGEKSYLQVGEAGFMTQPYGQNEPPPDPDQGIFALVATEIQAEVSWIQYCACQGKKIAPYVAFTEMRVNEYTEGTQELPAIAVAPNGSFLVVWSGRDHAFDEWGVFARPFRQNRLTAGPEFRVSEETTGQQKLPSAGVDGQGRYVVTWLDQLSGSVPPDKVKVRRFGEIGQQCQVGATALSPEMEVAGTPELQYGPGVSVAADGRFVVSWVEKWPYPFKLRFRLYDGQDVPVPLTGVIEVPRPSALLDMTGPPRMAAASWGIVIVWTDFGWTPILGPTGTLFARRYAWNGDPLSASAAVVETDVLAKSPDVTITPSETFIVGYQRRTSPDPSDDNNIYLRHYGQDGVPYHAPLVVNPTPYSFGAPEWPPRVALAVYREDPADPWHLVVLWNHAEEVQNQLQYSIFARPYHGGNVPAPASASAVQLNTLPGQAWMGSGQGAAGMYQEAQLRAVWSGNPFVQDHDVYLRCGRFVGGVFNPQRCEHDNDYDGVANRYDVNPNMPQVGYDLDEDFVSDLFLCGATEQDCEAACDQRYPNDPLGLMWCKVMVCRQDNCIDPADQACSGLKSCIDNNGEDCYLDRWCWCPYHNPDQDDMDDDGVGDACEPEPEVYDLTWEPTEEVTTARNYTEPTVDVLLNCVGGVYRIQFRRWGGHRYVDWGPPTSCENTVEDQLVTVRACGHDPGLPPLEVERQCPSNSERYDSQQRWHTIRSTECSALGDTVSPLCKDKRMSFYQGAPLTTLKWDWQTFEHEMWPLLSIPLAGKVTQVRVNWRDLSAPAEQTRRITSTQWYIPELWCTVTGPVILWDPTDPFIIIPESVYWLGQTPSRLPAAYSIRKTQETGEWQLVTFQQDLLTPSSVREVQFHSAPPQVTSMGRTVAVADTALWNQGLGISPVIFLYGGQDSTGHWDNTLWIGFPGPDGADFYSSDELYAAGPERPPELVRPRLVFDPTRARLLAIGDGVQGNEDINHVWVFDLVEGRWSHAGRLFLEPEAHGFTVSADPERRRAILFGGELVSGGVSGKTFSLDLDTLYTTLIEPAGPPRTGMERTRCGAYLDRWTQELYVFGGHNGESATPETWKFDLLRRRWSDLGNPPGGPGSPQDPFVYFDHATSRLWTAGGVGAETGHEFIFWGLRSGPDANWVRVTALERIEPEQTHFEGTFYAHSRNLYPVTVPETDPWPGRVFDVHLHADSPHLGVRVYDSRMNLVGEDLSAGPDKHVALLAHDVYWAEVVPGTGFDPGQTANFTLDFRVARLRQVALYVGRDGVNDLEIVGNVALVTGTQGIEAVSLADPENPILLSHVDLPGFGQDLELCGSKACVALARGSASLQVVDISNPGNMVLRGSAQTPGVTRGLAARGDHVYLADDSCGVAIFDVYDPDAPQHTGTLALGGPALTVATHADRLFVSVLPHKVAEYNALEPRSPQLVSEFDIDRPADAFLRRGDQLHVSELNPGQLVLCLAAEHCPRGMFAEVFDLANEQAPGKTASYNGLLYPLPHARWYGRFMLVRTRKGFKVYEAVPEPTGGGK